MIVQAEETLPTATSGAETISAGRSSSLNTDARTERQQIIGEVDHQAAIAKRDYQVSVDIMPALHACTPLDAEVSTCRMAADRVLGEMEKKVLRASQERASAGQPTPKQPINVTIIDQRETIIIQKRPTAIPGTLPNHPRPPGHYKPHGDRDHKSAPPKDQNPRGSLPSLR
jgi:hypothetical protein